MDNEAAPQAPEENKPIEIDISDIDAADEAEMTVTVNGKLTTWIWTFAGPGHPKTIALSNRLSRDRLQREREIERARTNGKQWKPEVETPDEIRAKNVSTVVERLLRWSPAKLDGEILPFSPEAATKLLSDPRKISLLLQALEFLGDDKAFTKRAATS
jgi:hypothetical protein